MKLAGKLRSEWFSKLKKLIKCGVGGGEDEEDVE